MFSHRRIVSLLTPTPPQSAAYLQDLHPLAAPGLCVISHERQHLSVKAGGAGQVWGGHAGIVPHFPARAKVLAGPADNAGMHVSAAAPSPTALAQAATARQGNQVRCDVAVAILNQVQDTERRQAEALLQMIQQTMAAARGGVDVYA
jgi:hypothetical protein